MRVRGFLLVCFSDPSGPMCLNHFLYTYVYNTYICIYNCMSRPCDFFVEATHGGSLKTYRCQTISLNVSVSTSSFNILVSIYHFQSISFKLSVSLYQFQSMSFQLSISMYRLRSIIFELLVKQSSWKCHLETFILKPLSRNYHLEILILKLPSWNSQLEALILKPSSWNSPRAIVTLQLLAWKRHLENQLYDPSSAGFFGGRQIWEIRFKRTCSLGFLRGPT